MPKTFAPGERYEKNYDERDIEQAVEAIKRVFRKNKLPKSTAYQEPHYSLDCLINLRKPAMDLHLY
ncbi:hypothetical protein ILUMI_14928 [Ignelater luminosus]|uniref:Uncharacterized protein n=1 Tax=Ignelater luminosus TaxID=2038154 RepID=A0A8K0CPN2_IGNLU|nr:hypothetical protein ILUMI_14928 [Ignelater luminosus]